jgi:hypothetical protein
MKDMAKRWEVEVTRQKSSEKIAVHIKNSG